MKRPLAWTGFLFCLGLSELAPTFLPFFACAALCIAAAFAACVSRHRGRGYFLAAAALAAGWCWNEWIEQRKPPEILQAARTVEGSILRIRGWIEQRRLSLEKDEHEIWIARWESLQTPTETIPIEGRWRLLLADPEMELRPGDRIEAFGKWKPPKAPSNPHEKARDRADFRREIWGSLESSGDCVRLLERPAFSWQAAMHRLRMTALSSLRRHFDPPQAEIAGPLLLGIWPREAPESIDLFRRTGAIHLLAVSGMHVSLLFGALANLAMRRLKKRGWILAALIFWLFLYSGLTGFQAPVLRASFMMGIAALALVLRRPCDGLTALGAAAWIVGLLLPAEIEGASFQLSFVATAGMILFAPSIRTALTRNLPRTEWPGRFAKKSTRALALSLAASGTSLPILVYHFHAIPLACIPATLLASPFLSSLMIAGYAALLLPGILAQAGVSIFEVLQTITLLVLESVDSILGNLVPTGNFPWWIVAAWNLGLLLLFQKKFRRWSFLLLFLGVGGFASYCANLSISHLPSLRIDILDVGHGNAIVIRSSQGTCTLFDAGSSSRRDLARSVLLPFLQAEGIRKIDTLVISHDDADHWNAVPELLAQIPVQRIFAGPGVKERLAALLSPADARRLVEVLGPMQWDEAALSLRLWRADSERVLTENDASLSLQIRVGDKSVVLCGDLEEDGIQAWLESEEDLQANILLLPHHGLPARGLDALLERVDPDWAIASCGRRFPGEGESPPGWETRFRCTAREGAIRIELQAPRR